MTIATTMPTIPAAHAFHPSLGGGYDANPRIANTKPEIAKTGLISMPSKNPTDPKGGNAKHDNTAPRMAGKNAFTFLGKTSHIKNTTATRIRTNDAAG